MVKGVISDIQKFSIHDGPGIRTTVFLKGCPLKCRWCGNPETISHKPEIMFSADSCMGCEICLKTCPQGAIKAIPNQPLLRNQDLCIACGICAERCPKSALLLRGRSMSISELMTEIEKDMPFYKRSGGGVTLSGGEPFLQADFTKEVLKACTEKEIHTVVDTCGKTNWRSIEQSMEYIDLFLYDIKHLDPAVHKKGTTVSNELILENLTKLFKLGKNVLLSLPLIPGFNTSNEDIKQIGVFARDTGAKALRILPYHNYGRGKYLKIGKQYGLIDLQKLSQSKVDQVKQILERYIPKVSIGG